MPGKRIWISGLLLALFGSAGCCGWCHRHCGCAAPATVVPTAAAPAPNGCYCPPPQPCCCPTGSAPIQPIPAPPAPPPGTPANFSRPVNNGCGPN
jgi:hypothetical protein